MMYVVSDTFNEVIVSVFSSQMKADHYIEVKKIEDQASVETFELDPLPLSPGEMVLA